MQQMVRSDDEYVLMDKLATKLGIAGPESQEERNGCSLYKRRVLRAAIEALDRAWGRDFLSQALNEGDGVYRP